MSVHIHHHHHGVSPVRSNFNQGINHGGASIALALLGQMSNTGPLNGHPWLSSGVGGCTGDLFSNFFSGLNGPAGHSCGCSPPPRCCDFHPGFDEAVRPGFNEAGHFKRKKGAGIFKTSGGQKIKLDRGKIKLKRDGKDFHIKANDIPATDGRKSYVLEDGTKLTVFRDGNRIGRTQISDGDETYLVSGGGNLINKAEGFAAHRDEFRVADGHTEFVHDHGGRRAFTTPAYFEGAPGYNQSYLNDPRLAWF